MVDSRWCAGRRNKKTMEKKTPRRSKRIWKKGQETFEMPSKEDVLGEIEKRSTKDMDLLRPKKLINNFIAKNYSYNNREDMPAMSDDSEEEEQFIDDRDVTPLKRKKRHREKENVREGGKKKSRQKVMTWDSDDEDGSEGKRRSKRISSRPKKEIQKYDKKKALEKIFEKEPDLKEVIESDDAESFVNDGEDEDKLESEAEGEDEANAEDVQLISGGDTDENTAGLGPAVMDISSQEEVTDALGKEAAVDVKEEQSSADLEVMGSKVGAESESSEQHVPMLQVDSNKQGVTEEGAVTVVHASTVKQQNNAGHNNIYGCEERARFSRTSADFVVHQSDSANSCSIPNERDGMAPVVIKREVQESTKAIPSSLLKQEQSEHTGDVDRSYEDVKCLDGHSRGRDNNRGEDHLRVRSENVEGTPLNEKGVKNCCKEIKSANGSHQGATKMDVVNGNINMKNESEMVQCATDGEEKDISVDHIKTFLPLGCADKEGSSSDSDSDIKTGRGIRSKVHRRKQLSKVLDREEESESEDEINNPFLHREKKRKSTASIKSDSDSEAGP